MAIASINPATGELLRTFDPLSDSQIEAKIQTAAATFLQFRKLTFADRGRMMTHAANILEDEKEALGRLMTTEMGKTLSSAIAEAAKCATACRYYADNAEQFLADERQGTLFGIFVGIAIFIACLGLFGLAAFTVGRRTKEIGIRKVFGARVRDVVFLLLWQFSIPVLIANAIAWPVAWYYLHDWLQGFAYRITLSPLYFVGAGAIALAIAWATVFVHALRVARANPIHALRYE